MIAIFNESGILPDGEGCCTITCMGVVGGDRGVVFWGSAGSWLLPEG